MYSDNKRTDFLGLLPFTAACYVIESLLYLWADWCYDRKRYIIEAFYF